MVARLLGEETTSKTVAGLGVETNERAVGRQNQQSRSSELWSILDCSGYSQAYPISYHPVRFNLPEYTLVVSIHITHICCKTLSLPPTYSAPNLLPHVLLLQR